MIYAMIVTGDTAKEAMRQAALNIDQQNAEVRSMLTTKRWTETKSEYWEITIYYCQKETS